MSNFILPEFHIYRDAHHAFEDVDKMCHNIFVYFCGMDSSLKLLASTTKVIYTFSFHINLFTWFLKTEGNSLHNSCLKALALFLHNLNLIWDITF